jgi:polyphosphate kinase 2 (PPK2 family)
VTVLSQVVLSRTISEEEYADQLTRYQALLGRLAREAAAQERSILIVFEGWGAAGKGGCIKRLTEGLDPRGYIVYPMNTLQCEDQNHQYLYRYWRRLPERGRIAIFDRGWYSRV